jgi:hypothetical protein
MTSTSRVSAHRRLTTVLSAPVAPAGADTARVFLCRTGGAGGGLAVAALVAVAGAGGTVAGTAG